MSRRSHDAWHEFVDMSSAYPGVLHSEQLEHSNLTGKEFQFKTLWRRSFLLGMLFLSKSKAFVKLNGLLKSFRLKLRFQWNPKPHIMARNIGRRVYAAVHWAWGSWRRTEREFMTIYWSESTLSSCWLGGSALRHGCFPGSVTSTFLCMYVDEQALEACFKTRRSGPEASTCATVELRQHRKPVS